ncbi:MAG: hypothetical protein WC758_06030 [Candidatus Woesearchaeota archaeon]|jgi:hypothetical protein
MNKHQNTNTNNFSHDKLQEKMFLVILSIFLASLIIEIGFHFLLFKESGIIIKYLQWFLYLDLSLAFLGGAIWHYLSYDIKNNCMTSMMLGMTLGMQVGMMIGAIIGATNGFFIGATTGVILGVAAGAWAGYRNGSTMGIMQGFMSGVMGGTMGPMITVMMFSDHLNWFMPLYLVLNVIILLFMSKMYFEESVKNNEDTKIVNVSYSTIIFVAIIATVILTTIILFLPKSPFLAVI